MESEPDHIWLRESGKYSQNKGLVQAGWTLTDGFYSWLMLDSLDQKEYLW